jgi:nucleoside-triphosphatase
MMKKNILLTGEPKSGKSTLLERIVTEVPDKQGFLTREVLDNGIRTGFKIITDSGQQTTLASTRITTAYQVPRFHGDAPGAYYVNVSGFEHTIAQLFTYTPKQLLYIDEIGKMELFSNLFKALARQYLDADNRFIGTISKAHNDNYTEAVRTRTDVTIIEVTPENREQLYQDILQEIRAGATKGN